MKVLISAILFSFLTSGCTKQENMTANPVADPVITNPVASSGTFSYLALGDSYTIGESVKQAESFPYQLQNLLKGKNHKRSRPQNYCGNRLVNQRTAGWH